MWLVLFIGFEEFDDPKFCVKICKLTLLVLRLCISLKPLDSSKVNLYFKRIVTGTCHDKIYQTQTYQGLSEK